jgi:hypothetical protein
MGLRREGALVKSTPTRVQVLLCLKVLCLKVLCLKSDTIARPVTRNGNHGPQKPKSKPL